MKIRSGRVWYLSALLLALCLGVLNAYAWWRVQASPAQSPPVVNGPAKSPPFASPSGPAGSAEMQAANAAAAELVRERMKRDRQQDFALLQKVKKTEVVVVRGQYDHVQTVLAAVQVPHLVIDPEDLDTVELNASQLLLINCPGNIGNAGIARIRKFVNAGGFLFTTDWSLLNVLEKAFPGIVEYTRKPTADDVVGVRVLKKDNHFLQHVQNSGDTPRWWLEGSSYPIRVLDTRKVEILMESDEMKRKYGEAPIAITFKYGDGQVLHVVSHYYLQRTETRTAAEKAGGEEFSKSLGLKAEGATAAALRRTTAGAARDAYSAQQLGANVVVAKQRQNLELDRIYNHRIKATVVLRISPAENSGKVADLQTGALLKILEKKDNWWKVQTYSGDVGWIESPHVEKR